MTVYFHGSFGLNRTYMAGVLEHSMRKPRVSDADLAEPFEYGKPFA